MLGLVYACTLITNTQARLLNNIKLVIEEIEMIKAMKREEEWIKNINKTVKEENKS